MDHSLDGVSAEADGKSPSKADILDAYKVLLDFQKWTYDTYQRDSRFFLATELVLLGLVIQSIDDSLLADLRSFSVTGLAILLGIFLTILWAGRQRREFYMAKGRLERLKKLEADLPEPYAYFSVEYERTKARVESSGQLPVLGNRFRSLPNFYRSDSFLRSIILQQVIFLIWLCIGIYLVQAVWVGWVLG